MHACGLLHCWLKRCLHTVIKCLVGTKSRRSTRRFGHITGVVCCSQLPPRESFSWGIFRDGCYVSGTCHVISFGIGREPSQEEGKETQTRQGGRKGSRRWGKAFFCVDSPPAHSSLLFLSQFLWGLALIECLQTQTHTLFLCFKKGSRLQAQQALHLGWSNQVVGFALSDTLPHECPDINPGFTPGSREASGRPSRNLVHISTCTKRHVVHLWVLPNWLKSCRWTKSLRPGWEADLSVIQLKTCWSMLVPVWPANCTPTLSTWSVLIHTWQIHKTWEIRCVRVLRFFATSNEHLASCMCINTVASVFACLL